MMTWVQSKRVRQLRTELRRLAKEYEPTPNMTEDERMALHSEHMMERTPVEFRLLTIETNELLGRAKRWLIDEELVYDKDGSAYGERFLTEEVANKLRRRIRDERRGAAKFWVGVVAQPLSLLVALAGVSVGLLSHCG